MTKPTEETKPVEREAFERRLLQRLKRLPKYPYHTWDREDSGHHQELIGLDERHSSVERKPPMSKPRYWVEGTRVFDRDKSDLPKVAQYIAECFTLESAELICAALNGRRRLRRETECQKKK